MTGQLLQRLLCWSASLVVLLLITTGTGTSIQNADTLCSGANSSLTNGWKKYSSTQGLDLWAIITTQLKQYNKYEIYTKAGNPSVLCIIFQTVYLLCPIIKDIDCTASMTLSQPVTRDVQCHPSFKEVNEAHCLPKTVTTAAPKDKTTTPGNAVTIAKKVTTQRSQGSGGGPS